MKQVILAILLTLTISAFSQNKKINAIVDERTELLSIVFRLAGAHEYSMDFLPNYTNDISNYFEKFKDHDVIKYAKVVRKINGISFDAVMSFAIHIEISDSIILKKNISEKSLDDRWNLKNAEKFTKLLSDFYKATNFNSFFTNHKGLYTIAQERFDSLLTNTDFKWFDTFYGQEPKDNFNLIVSLSNGAASYATNIIYKQGKEEIYSIIGTWKTDSLEMPVYSTGTISTIVHEFNHSFCNDLIDKNIKELETSGKVIFSKVEKQMTRQAYGSYQTMLYEALVRASVIKYNEYIGKEKNYINRLIAKNQGLGFVWIDKLFNKLSVYEKNRNKYSTLESFMPEIVLLYDSIANNVESIFNNFDKNCPKIIYSSVKNNSKIKSSTKQIIFKFDQPMQTGYGFIYGEGEKKFFPKIDKVEYFDKQTLIVTIDLKPKHKYSMRFYLGAYISESNYPLENFKLKFRTKE